MYVTAAMTSPGCMPPACTWMAPTQMRATVARLRTMFMIGRRNDIRMSTRSWVSTREVFAASKRAASRSSWMKALTTRVPLMFSWMTLLSPSILPCRRVKSGLVFQRMKPMSSSTSGNAQAMITRKCTLRLMRVIVPTTMNIRQRIKPRTSCCTSRSTCETSLVTRVMSEPVVKASVCSNERCMILSKHFLRMVLPKFWLHRLAMVPLSMPKSPPARTIRII